MDAEQNQNGNAQGDALNSIVESNILEKLYHWDMGICNQYQGKDTLFVRNATTKNEKDINILLRIFDENEQVKEYSLVGAEISAINALFS